MAKQYDKEFKLNAVRYYYENKKIGMSGCAKKHGIAASTLGSWIEKFQDTQDIQDTQNTQNHGSFNYALVKSKDVERFKQKMCQAQDLLDDLKKILDSWEITVTIFEAAKTETV